MTPEVNATEHGAEKEKPSPSARALAEPAVVGSHLVRLRSGPCRVLQLLTGLASLRWLGFSVGWILGYRCPGIATLRQNALDLEAKRSFMGVDLRPSRQVIPLSELHGARLRGPSGWWTLVAGIGSLIGAVAVASVLLVWGVAGRELSWALWGVLVLGLGALLDSLAYLWARRQKRLGDPALEIEVAGRRFRLMAVKRAAAQRLLDGLTAAGRRGH